MLSYNSKCNDDKSIWQMTEMLYIIISCPQTKLQGGLHQIHLADIVAVQWLTAYDFWMHMTVAAFRMHPKSG